jgi:hypothetical protein
MHLLLCWVPGGYRFNRNTDQQKIDSRCHRWLWVLFLVFAFPVPQTAAAKASANLILFDQWVESDHSVWLRARLISGSGSLIQSKISGERIEFSIDGQPLGPVLTGGDGIAAARYLPPRRGTYVIKASLIDNPRYEAPEVEALLLYGRLGRKVIVIALDSTQTLPKPPRFPFIPVPPPEPIRKVTTVLDQLSREYQLIYVWNGEDVQLLEIREWLDKQNYPKAPLFAWHLSEKPETRTKQMIEQLGKFKPFAHLYLGITRSVADAKAFLSLGMKAVVLSEDIEVELPEGSIVTTDWDALPLLIGES